MRCGDLHLRIQYILETSVRFDGNTNKFNVRTVLASRNTQRQEEQVTPSTIRRQATESLQARRSGMDYSQGIQFQTSLVNMEEAKGLTMNNQEKQCKCGSVKHLRISHKDFHVALAIRKARNLALETEPSKLEAKKEA